jgi:hypothetical protein
MKTVKKLISLTEQTIGEHSEETNVDNIEETELGNEPLKKPKL